MASDKCYDLTPLPIGDVEVSNLFKAPKPPMDGNGGSCSAEGCRSLAAAYLRKLVFMSDLTLLPV